LNHPSDATAPRAAEPEQTETQPEQAAAAPAAAAPAAEDTAPAVPADVIPAGVAADVSPAEAPSALAPQGAEAAAVQPDDAAVAMSGAALRDGGHGDEGRGDEGRGDEGRGDEGRGDENPGDDAQDDDADDFDRDDDASDEDEEGPTEEDEKLAEEAAKTTFADLGLSEPILRAVAESGYLYPTPIQEQAIPIVLMGRDVMGVAQTGTGKTAGFTLPMLDILAGTRAKARMPRSLILEPTRELALQVAEQFVKYGKHLNLNHALLIGGESMNDQRDVLEKGVDVLIATPGRLLDLFDRGRILLADCKVLVIDEADRMLDMGFIPDVEKIVSFLPKLRQTLFFSATMAPEIRRLADQFLQNPKEISVSRAASVAVTITAGLVWVRELDKREALRRLLRREEVQNALIFCNRKVDVDILYKSLKKHGFSVGALHGDMEQSARFTTLNRFKAGDIKLLVCSDVAARGLDIGGLSHVFNFDIPFHAEDYVHRIGRTGRAGREGNAYTLCAPEDAKSLAAIEKLTGKPIPRMEIDGLDPVTPEEIAEGAKARRGRGGKVMGRGGDKGGDRAGDRAGERGGGRGRRDGGPRREDRAADAPRAAAPIEDRVPATRDDRAPDARRDGRRDQPRRDDRRPRREDRAPSGREDRAPSGREDRAAEPLRDDRPSGPREDRAVAPRREDRAPAARRDDYRRDEPRREEYRRDRRDDLGPPVRGFGDSVPAFMTIPIPRPRRDTAAEPEAEAA
jgi:superfamily II DNA/RNA helicase